MVACFRYFKFLLAVLASFSIFAAASFAQSGDVDTLSGRIGTLELNSRFLLLAGRILRKFG